MNKNDGPLGNINRGPLDRFSEMSLGTQIGQIVDNLPPQQDQ